MTNRPWKHSHVVRGTLEGIWWSDTSDYRVAQGRPLLASADSRMWTFRKSRWTLSTLLRTGPWKLQTQQNLSSWKSFLTTLGTGCWIWLPQELPPGCWRRRLLSALDLLVLLSEQVFHRWALPPVLWPLLGGLVLCPRTVLTASVWQPVKRYKTHSDSCLRHNFSLHLYLERKLVIWRAWVQLNLTGTYEVARMLWNWLCTGFFMLLPLRVRANPVQKKINSVDLYVIKRCYRFIAIKQCSYVGKTLGRTQAQTYKWFNQACVVFQQVRLPYAMQVATVLIASHKRYNTDPFPPWHLNRIHDMGLGARSQGRVLSSYSDRDTMNKTTLNRISFTP